MSYTDDLNVEKVKLLEGMCVMCTLCARISFFAKWYDGWCSLTTYWKFHAIKVLHHKNPRDDFRIGIYNLWPKVLLTILLTRLMFQHPFRGHRWFHQDEFQQNCQSVGGTTQRPLRKIRLPLQAVRMRENINPGRLLLCCVRWSVLVLWPSNSAMLNNSSQS